MDKNIYAVVHSYYSDWTIYGYFHNREDAEKYCLAHPEQDLYVEELPCYDDIDNRDFVNIQPKYEFTIVMNPFTNNEVEVGDHIPYKSYQSEFLRSNYIKFTGSRYIALHINTTDYNIIKVKKIAFDLYYQFMEFCDKHPNKNNVEKFNLILNKEEREREALKKQKELEEKELAELKRLKEKYEK